MGLLTDPKKRAKFIAAIKRFGNVFCVLFYLAGLVWFLALAYKPFNAGVYFSENALLPGLVKSEFFHEYDAGRYYTDLRAEARKNKRDTPIDWLENSFRDLGLDTYVQNYTFTYPFNILDNKKISGRNVYGILRAPRAGSTEALVVSVPYRPPASELKKTNAGIALMLALAKSFRRHTFWAKDIIFLVTSHETLGMQAWLDGYHNSKSDYIFPGELHGRSGAIQAALNLEIATDRINYLNVHLEGLNGQLPNLDLVNTAVSFCMAEQVPARLHGQQDHYNPESEEGYVQALKTMMLMMWSQASGSPSGNHGLFHKYQIEAVTLEGVKLKGSVHTHDFLPMGKVVEGIVRALNNLLERFHQSFFFYLLPATDRYVSIGLYMPPFGLLAAGSLIKISISLWIDSSQPDPKDSDKGDDDADDDKKKEEKEEKKEEEKKEEKKEKKKEKKEGGASPSKAKKEKGNEEGKEEGAEEKEEKVKEKVYPVSSTLLSTVPIMLMCHIFGLLAYVGPDIFIESAKPFRMQPGEGLMFGGLALMLSAMIFPRLLKRKSKQGLASSDWRVVKCVCLIILSLVLFSIALMNISLAFFLTAVLVPVCIFIRPCQSRLGHWFQVLLLLAVSPLTLIYVAGLVQTQVSKVTEDTMVAAWENAQDALLISVVDSYMYSNWLFSVATLLLFPNWLLFWSILWSS